MLFRSKLSRLVKGSGEDLVEDETCPEDAQSFLHLRAGAVGLRFALSSRVLGRCMLLTTAILMTSGGSRERALSCTAVQIHVECHPTGNTADLKSARRVSAAELDHADQNSSLDGANVLGELALKDARLDPVDKVVAELVGLERRLRALRRFGQEHLQDRICALLLIFGGGIEVCVERVGGDGEDGLEDNGT